jgi:hypothetical protein
MKKLLTIISILAINAIGFAQAPEKFSYQAVVRDAGGSSVVSQLVGVKVSILQTSSLGTPVFVETHGPITNGYGLINLQIGAGSNTGPALSSIDWGLDNYFIKIEIDPTGGTSYSVSSVSQLLSVPYALYAKTAENVDDADADPANEYNTGAAMNADTLEITDGGGTLEVDLSNLKTDPDMDPTNEIQLLSKVGQVVSLTNGGGAFTDEIDDADSDPANEFNTTVSLVGTTLLITDAGGTLNADLSSLSGDADADPNNEIQTISKTGSTVTLSMAGGSFTDEINDADSDPTNEMQSISKVGSTVTLSGPGGSFIDDVDDADADASNELQTLTQAGSTVTLSDGGGSINIDDADADATNEYNTGAILAGTDLNITDAGSTITVDLSSLVGGGDPSITNELIISANLTGTDLNIIDAGGTTTVDLSTLGGGADPSSTNELIISANLTGTDLNIIDAGGTTTVDLSSLSGGGGSAFKVGQYYQGGIIIYVDTNGTGGLIAGLTDLSSDEFFEFSNTTPLLATDSTDGETNTANLMAGAGNYEAANLCVAYSVGGYSDWFLPSVYELELMANSKYIMGGYALAYDGEYWSSTELETSGFGLSAFSIQASPVFIQGVSQGSNSPPKSVRPMRSFP